MTLTEHLSKRTIYLQCHPCTLLLTVVWPFLLLYVSTLFRRLYQST